MPHWRLLWPTKYLCAADLGGRDVTVEIEKVEKGQMTEIDDVTKKRREVEKPIIHFKGKSKQLACNPTNAKTIVELYGTNTEDWLDKRITLYPTTCLAFGKTVECVRIRPKVPEPRKARA